MRGGDHASRQFALGAASPALEAADVDGSDTGHGHGSGDDGGQIEWRTEGEAVGMEEAGPAMPVDAGGEGFEQRGFDVGGEVAAGDADLQLDIERDMHRVGEFEVVAGQPEAFEEGAQGRLEGGIDRLAAAPVDHQENGVPAAGPAQAGGGALHVGMALGGAGVVVGGDGALLRAESFRGIEADGVERFRLSAALRR